MEQYRIKLKLGRILILLAALIFYNFSCTNCETLTTNRFIIPFTPLVSPAYSFGESITISSEFSSVFITEQGQEIDNSNQSCSIKFRIFEIHQNNIDATGALDKFDIVENDGNFNVGTTNNTFSGSIVTTCDENICKIDIAFKPLKKGYFCISTQGGSFSFNQDDCISNYTEMLLAENDNNFSLLEEIGLDLVRLDRTLYKSSEREDLYFF